MMSELKQRYERCSSSNPAATGARRWLPIIISQSDFCENASPSMKITSFAGVIDLATISRASAVGIRGTSDTREGRRDQSATKVTEG
jgi:hypothetical protein